MMPSLITFDVFGTIVDWRTGLQADLAKAGHPCSDALFDRIIAAQATSESGPFRSYSDITAASLVQVAGLDATAADHIGQRLGQWPLFPDARDALQRLQRLVPCIAMTNSDLVHGQQVQDQLGFQLTGWLCAEEVRLYKPNPAFWLAVTARQLIEPGSIWWHVSAYADYDLRTATKLGLTTVFVARPHSQRGPTDYRVADLAGLAELVDGLSG
jgi:2-haloacid dehalogenase